jgi:hypothetical protein
MTKPSGQRAVQGDSLRDVVTTSRWNSLMDMLDEWQKSRGQFAVTPGDVPSSSCVIEVMNDTGSDLDRWACVELGAVTVLPSENADEFAERHVIKGRTPTTSSGAKYAILQEAIPAGEIGRALICGVTLATVDVSDLGHGFATPQYGAERLTSSTSGSTQIIYAETTGIVDALVSLGGGGSGGGAPRIRFTILSTDFTVGNGALGCDHVVAVVTHVSCSGAGVEVDDEVRIYDPEYCHFNLPIELLIGLSGTATKMDASNYQPGLDYVLDCLYEIRTDGCIWMIDTLCCAEEEYIGG